MTEYFFSSTLPHQLQLVLPHFTSGRHGQPGDVLAQGPRVGRLVLAKRHGVHPRPCRRLQPLAEGGRRQLGLRPLPAVLQEGAVSRAGRRQVTPKAHRHHRSASHLGGSVNLGSFFLLVDTVEEAGLFMCPGERPTILFTRLLLRRGSRPATPSLMI